jgi:indole-3-glycerol phosphate synthase
MQTIAEVKTYSPFDQWHSDRSRKQLTRIADKVGDMVAEHTNPRWHGSYDLVTQAKQRTDKPVVAKGIHATDSEVVAAVVAGADYVLVVGRVPEVHIEKCLIEVESLELLRQLPSTVRAVWNARDLSTGRPKEETFEEARQVFSGWLCQASYITLPIDVHPEADAILVGTHLPTYAQAIDPDWFAEHIGPPDLIQSAK